MAELIRIELTTSFLTQGVCVNYEIDISMLQENPPVGIQCLGQAFSHLLADGTFAGLHF